MSAPGERDLTFKLYGLDHMQGHVFADVFAKKLAALIKGLRELDRAENGGRRFEYVIVGLEVSSAKVAIHEKRVVDKKVRKSPCAELVSVGRRVQLGETKFRDTSEPALITFEKLTKFHDKKFGYATLVDDDPNNVIRIDSFLDTRLAKVRAAQQKTAEELAPTFFEGSAWGAFDGTIKEVDFRGDVPIGHFFLSAGGKDIECIFHTPEAEIREALNQRSVIEGNAIYDGSSGLPARIEVRSIVTTRGYSILKWAGSFGEMEEPVWETDN